MTATEASAVPYDPAAMIQALLRGEKELVHRITLPFANQGVADAQVMMGVLCEAGLAVPRNGIAAVDWYRKAAAQNHPIAWSNLGTIFLLGLPDVKPDKLEAAYCFEKAQALRVTSAKKIDGAGVVR
jgi:TPR repeat protein